MCKPLTPEALQLPFRTESCAVHGVSLRGSTHERDGMPLQDSFAAARLDNGWIVLAVADGVGSEPKAETGARLAAAAAVNHLRLFHGYRVDDDSVRRMLAAAYHAACAAIFAQAVNDRAPLSAYSTTLHTVIFADGLLYLMHAGDGGVVIRTEEGDFRRVTSPMKGTDGESVIPLQGGPKSWQFSVCRDRAQSVLLVTDGLWDKLCPSILQAYGDETGVERSIASFFLSPWARNWKEDPLEEISREERLLFRGTEDEAIPAFYETLVSALAQGEDPSAARELVKEKVAPGNMPVRMLRGIQDDITLLSLVRFDPLPRVLPPDHFTPVNWQAVNRWARDRLYSAESAAGETRPDLAARRAAENQNPEIVASEIRPGFAARRAADNQNPENTVREISPGFAARRAADNPSPENTVCNIEVSQHVGDE